MRSTHKGMASMKWRVMRQDCLPYLPPTLAMLVRVSPLDREREDRHRGG